MNIWYEVESMTITITTLVKRRIYNNNTVYQWMIMIIILKMYEGSVFDLEKGHWFTVISKTDTFRTVTIWRVKSDAHTAPRVAFCLPLQSNLSKMDTFGTSTKCPSHRDARLVKSQIGRTPRVAFCLPLQSNYSKTDTFGAVSKCPS